MAPLRKLQVVLFACALLIATPAQSRPRAKTQEPWRRFLNVLRGRTAAVIQNSPTQLTFKGVADAIVEDLETMQEPETNRTGREFRVTYSAVVWRLQIPADARDILISPLARSRFMVTPDPKARNGIQRILSRPSPNSQHAGPEQAGMLPNGECSRKFRPVADPHIGEFGEFGWPCQIGGAVSVTQAGPGAGSPLNCIVFYLPIRPDKFPPEDLFDMRYNFQAALERALKRQERLLNPASRQAIDLQDLALDLDEGFVLYSMPEVKVKSRNERSLQIPGHARAQEGRLRGVAIVPSTSDETAAYGLRSPEGCLIVKRVLVPPSPSFNLEHQYPGQPGRLTLYIVTLARKWHD